MQGVCEEQALSATDDKKLKSCFPPTKTPQHNNVLRLGTPEDKGNVSFLLAFSDLALLICILMKSHFLFLDSCQGHV